ncbi:MULTISPECIES: RidA family protein [Eubacterium]|jgi:putative endoribonuclease L-PSP|uniref:RidA family protein n=1 Tax=Eubacterium TaxID=1730 RepID=UPI0015ADDB2D|nr:MULTISPECIES: RidA family protein [Eubacterium]MCI6354969.1 RidA family protein [Eubacterium coprostanoligenes]MCI7264120.1 RidA family protein [Eubacterium coprostanoligenes]MDD6665708.1 RidA family protein [Eubacterium coprostanoligenes]MDD7357905.1 RidA family protein [Eubacterium coprostanoligenes]MDY4698892.1 RidA family protein [Eubacterium coprostanoligenes]
MEYVATNNAPNAIGPYSQAVKANGLLFTSGQIAINPATNTVEAKTIEEQTTQVCENLKAVVEAAGTDMSKVVKTVCFLADINDFGAFNEIYGKYFTSKPARSCVAVKDLPKGVLCEVELIAEL